MNASLYHQEAAGKEAHLPAIHDVGNVALHDGGQWGDVLPVHVHKENVSVGDGPGKTQSRKIFRSLHIL